MMGQGQVWKHVYMNCSTQLSNVNKWLANNMKALPNLSSEEHGLLTANTSCDFQDEVAHICLFLRNQQIQDLIGKNVLILRTGKWEMTHGDKLTKIPHKKSFFKSTFSLKIKIPNWTFLLSSWISCEQLSLSISASSRRAGSSSVRTSKNILLSHCQSKEHKNIRHSNHHWHAN